MYGEEGSGLYRPKGSVIRSMVGQPSDNRSHPESGLCLSKSTEGRRSTNNSDVGMKYDNFTKTC